MKTKDKFALILMITLIIGFVFFSTWNTKRIDEKYHNYYMNDTNGIVNRIIKYQGGELALTLKSKNNEIQTGISHVIAEFIEIGDSISKPKYSEYLECWRKLDDTIIFKTYYIEKFDQYKWKRPVNWNDLPDWNEKKIKN